VHYFDNKAFDMHQC